MIDADLERLRQAWASLPGARLPGCAPPEEIWDAVLGQLSEAQATALLEHSVGCADCAAVWRLGREISAGAQETVAPPRLRRPAFPPRWRWVAGAGALAAAAVLAFALVPRRVAPEAPVLRGSDAEGLRPALGEAVLRRAHPVLRWTGGADGSRYAVTVSTPDLTVLHRASGLSTPELELPATALTAVPPGGEIVWRVEATTPDGRRVSSGAFLLRVE